MWAGFVLRSILPYPVGFLQALGIWDYSEQQQELRVHIGNSGGKGKCYQDQTPEKGPSLGSSTQLELLDNVPALSSGLYCWERIFHYDEDNREISPVE
ncbi:hypothetical protein Y1Q_0004583 [Alligator mississippiensis]|uniref:Uncharacterized protein n=1 Tax=Alligator mississippiensis TaxID=8496 RepID=A0A151MHK5_ALLMI|nr:hypothetical protein Y1Q_0004583 [Alligator mississippiensis]